MRFALKAIPLAALGCAAALLVACGDRSGLLSGGDASSLQDALASVQSACANGRPDDAALAAQRFSDRVDALSPQAVDRQLIANLQQGASTLEQLASRTCTPTTPTTPTTTATTTTATTTTPTTSTQPTTPTTPTATTTTPTTPAPPDTGGGTPPGHGGTPPGQGGTPPGQSGDGGGGASPGGDGG
jgi:hypothetical protein